ncbi:hypothetical protein BVY04_00200 [bacterium M21]|nr:hypothetical protein BVY04_00200 [bacterium M21]
MKAIRSTLVALTMFVACRVSSSGTELHISTNGDDSNPGTAQAPLRTLSKARDVARSFPRSRSIEMILSEGSYYLNKPLVFGPEDSGSKEFSVTWRPEKGAKVRLVGGQPLHLKWRPHTDKIWKASVPEGTVIDQLFIKDKRQILARYPNYDPNERYYCGAASTWERMAGWKNPDTAYIHALHKAKWGSGHIMLKRDGSGELYERMISIDTTTQGNRATLNDELRFAENVFEELDAEQEWFYDIDTHTLYYQPGSGVDLQSAKVEVISNPHLVRFEGTSDKPVKHITFEGFTVSGASPTWKMTTDHLPNGGDFVVHRGGAVTLTGTEDCVIRDCSFIELSGNAVFINGYNRRATVQDCLIKNIGANGIALCGAAETMRGEQFFTVTDETIKKGRLVRNSWLAPGGWSAPPEDLTPGPKSDDYPSKCVIKGNLITISGELEKQSAGVLISLAKENSVSHNTIFNLPRAGICIQDGSWGGHMIEHNDVFDTVRETADHGPFNSWGKDRYWIWADHTGKHNPDAKKNCLIDAMTPTHIRHNRFSHPIKTTHSWGIDLDDGSTNYKIYNNLTLGCAVKLREGFYRTVENNVFIAADNNAPGKHICFNGNDDVYRKNIVVNISGRGVWRGIRHLPKEMKEMDYNCYFTPGTTPTFAGSKWGVNLVDWQKEGLGVHSIIADPLFVNPKIGDYRVKPNSPALKLGFKNFPMDEFGVTSPDLKKLVPSRDFLTLTGSTTTQNKTISGRSGKLVQFYGGTVKNMVDEAEKSAVGIGEITGVLIMHSPDGSALYKAGLRNGNLIISCNKTKVHTVKDLLSIANRLGKDRPVTVEIHNDLQERKYMLKQLNILQSDDK